MIYVEFWRARNVLMWYAVGLLAIVALIVISMGHATVEVNDTKVAAPELIPLSLLLGLAAYAATIMATILGSSLSCLSDQLPNAWTKPESRERIALSFFVVDVAAIVLLFVLAVGCGLFVLLQAHMFAHLSLDAQALPVGLLGLGMALMWYGLAQAATAWRHGRGGMIAGLSWPAFLVLLVLASAPLPALLHGIVIALNVLNPLAYFGISSHNGNVDVESVFPFSLNGRIAIVYALGLAGCALAVFGWKRLEV
ncbi:MAG TPA: hypothetical protein VKG44_03000 [Candidatus Baltobacteraceae bacterium]|nr:hypothetical protein [Candidatus Baltobacteraceae bacterium]